MDNVTKQRDVAIPLKAIAALRHFTGLLFP
jgi:hypothetical protein